MISVDPSGYTIGFQIIRTFDRLPLHQARLIKDIGQSVAEAKTEFQIIQQQAQTRDVAPEHLRATLMDSLRVLSPTKRAVIMGLYGLNGVSVRTVDEMAASLSLTVDEVEEVRRAALSDLHTALKLAGFDLMSHIKNKAHGGACSAGDDLFVPVPL